MFSGGLFFFYPRPKLRSVNKITYRLELNKLEREREKLDKSLRSKVRRAREEGGEQLAGEVWQTDEERFALDNQKELIRLHITSYLRLRADQLLIDFPRVKEEEGLWEAGPYSHRYYLTRKGIEEVRSKIRKEERERQDVYLRWGSVLIGIIGALAGLIAVIKS